MTLRMLVEFTINESGDDGEGKTLENICAALEAQGYIVEFSFNEDRPDVALLKLTKSPLKMAA